MAIDIYSSTFKGINGKLVNVEIDITNGLPSFNIVGLPDISVKESKERVRSAIINSGFNFPIKRITVNLAPGDLKKEGSLLDLPIAIGILIATNQIKVKNYKDYLFIGELSLSGELKKVKGVLPVIIEGINNSINKFIIPTDNKNEAVLVNNAKIYPFSNLEQIKNFLEYEDLLPYSNTKKVKTTNINYDLDFSDIVGQESSIRAVEVAAAGKHNIIMFGSPGCGKTMIQNEFQLYFQN